MPCAEGGSKTSAEHQAMAVKAVPLAEPRAGTPLPPTAGNADTRSGVSAPRLWFLASTEMF